MKKYQEKNSFSFYNRTLFHTKNVEACLLFDAFDLGISSILAAKFPFHIEETKIVEGDKVSLFKTVGFHVRLDNGVGCVAQMIG